jgi:hypothetical protein
LRRKDQVKEEKIKEKEIEAQKFVKKRKSKIRAK